MNTEKTYHEYLYELVGFSACNSYGISGSTISNYYESMCNRVGGIDNQSDIIFVFGGTNDFQQNIPMGEWYTLNGTTRTVNYDKTTFRGALTTLCEALLTKFPNKRNVLITPLHRYTYPGDYTELQANSQGLYLEDYVNAIKEAGKIYSIPVIDLYSESGLCPMNAKSAATYFHSSDKLHPNAAGHRVIADVIRGYLDRTYPMYGEAASVTYDNLVPTSVDSSGAIFNGVGYQDASRINSSGNVVSMSGVAVTATGFIKVNGGDVVRVSGAEFRTGTDLGGGNANVIAAYNSSKNFLGSTVGGGANYGIFGSTCSQYDFTSVVEESAGVYKWVVPPTTSGIEWIRLSCAGGVGIYEHPGANLIVTINQGIT
jgi:lysophospholipase L1-like esterase